MWSSFVGSVKIIYDIIIYNRIDKLIKKEISNINLVLLSGFNDKSQYNSNNSSIIYLMLTI